MLNYKEKLKAAQLYTRVLRSLGPTSKDYPTFYIYFANKTW